MEIISTMKVEGEIMIVATEKEVTVIKVEMVVIDMETIIGLEGMDLHGPVIGRHLAI